MLICVAGLRGMPGVAGGVEAHCEELLPRLQARLPGARIRVFTRSCYCRPPLDQRRHQGLELVPLWTLRHKHLEALLHTAAAVLAARRAGAELLHLHAIGPGLLAPLARALGLAVVVTHHGADYRRSKWGRLARFALALGERLALQHAQRVIAVSAADAAALRARFPALAARITHIPNGAPRWAPGPPDPEGLLRRFGLLPGGFVLGVGRLVPEKRFADLIGAAAAAGRRLVIAGEADHADASSAELRRLGAEAGVVFTGRLPRGALAELYRGCALFVLPSSHEGLPMAALEALACGARVLLSDIPAHRELGLPEGAYFACGEVAKLARLLQAPPEKASAFDPSRYDWERIADLTVEVYVDALAALRRGNKRGGHPNNRANPNARSVPAHWDRPR